MADDNDTYIRDENHNGIPDNAEPQNFVEDPYDRSEYHDFHMFNKRHANLEPDHKEMRDAESHYTATVDVSHDHDRTREFMPGVDEANNQKTQAEQDASANPNEEQQKMYERASEKILINDLQNGRDRKPRLSQQISSARSRNAGKNETGLEMWGELLNGMRAGLRHRRDMKKFALQQAAAEQIKGLNAKHMSEDIEKQSGGKEARDKSESQNPREADGPNDNNPGGGDGPSGPKGKGEFEPEGPNEAYREDIPQAANDDTKVTPGVDREAASVKEPELKEPDAKETAVASPIEDMGPSKEFLAKEAEANTKEPVAKDGTGIEASEQSSDKPKEVSVTAPPVEEKQKPEVAAKSQSIPKAGEVDRAEATGGAGLGLAAATVNPVAGAVVAAKSAQETQKAAGQDHASVQKREDAAKKPAVQGPQKTVGNVPQAPAAAPAKKDRPVTGQDNGKAPSRELGTMGGNIAQIRKSERSVGLHNQAAKLTAEEGRRRTMRPAVSGPNMTTIRNPRVAGLGMNISGKIISKIAGNERQAGTGQDLTQDIGKKIGGRER